MTYADVPVQVRARIVAECIAFQHDNAASLADATDDSRKDPYDMRRAGHDFWFTRNGHGVGYWDRELGDVGDALDKAAKKAGGRDAYAGDDGKLYLSPA